MEDAPRPEQENFAEASLGEAQSSNPPSDPEMIDGDGEDQGSGDEQPEDGDAEQGGGPDRGDAEEGPTDS